MNLRKLIVALIVTLSLMSIIYLGVWVRKSTIDTSTVLDYDPWWWFRHAKEIVENNFHTPKWDILSFYPPGRQTEPFQGWPYTIAILYKILSSFTMISLTKVAILSPLIMVALIPIPAFFLGRILSNNIGGLAVALFAVLTPAFIGVSMAGYSDSDAPVVFNLFLSILTIFLALNQSKKGWLRFLPFAVLAILSNLFFVFTWGAGWLPQIFFLVLIPAFFIFKLIETRVHHKKFDLNIISQEVSPLLIPLLIIILASNVIGFSLGLGNVFSSFLAGLGFTGLFGALMIIFFTSLLASIGLITGLVFFKLRGAIVGGIIGFIIAILILIFGNASEEPLLVNISVAELQVINIFTKPGFWTVGDRIGLAPFLLTLIGLPLLLIYRIFKKEKISFAEIFLLLWWFGSFLLISRGVRFSLFFSVAAAISAGYVIANFSKYVKLSVLIVLLISLVLWAFNPSDKTILIPLLLSATLFLFSFLKKGESSFFHLSSLSTIYGIILVLSLIFVSNAIQSSYAASGMQVSQNWYDALDWLKNNADKDSLISTWWDPGHIIAGYTGLKVHADGAHCAPGVCIPYDHNTRIRDMGRIFSTNNESESVSILEKYKELTPEQCQAVKEKFGKIVPEDACKPVSDFYVIASSDLIGKYFWMSCFGSFDMKKWDSGVRDVGQLCNGKNFNQLQFSGFDKSGLPTYGSIVTLLQKDSQLMAVINYPQQGIRNAFIKEVAYFQNNQEFQSVINENTTNVLDGMLWIDPSFGMVIFMDSSVRDSVFTKMFFFNGENLKSFQLVYSNPELKIYKLKQ